MRCITKLQNSIWNSKYCSVIRLHIYRFFVESNLCRPFLDIHSRLTKSDRLENLYELQTDYGRWLSINSSKVRDQLQFNTFIPFVRIIAAHLRHNIAQILQKFANSTYFTTSDNNCVFTKCSETSLTISTRQESSVHNALNTAKFPALRKILDNEIKACDRALVHIRDVYEKKVKLTAYSQT